MMQTVNFLLQNSAEECVHYRGLALDKVLLYQLQAI